MDKIKFNKQTNKKKNKNKNKYKNRIIRYKV